MSKFGKITHIQFFQNQELIVIVFDNKVIRVLCLKRLEFNKVIIEMPLDEYFSLYL